MSASILAASALWLFFRARGRRVLLAFALVPLLVTSAPLWTRALRGDEATSILRAAPRDSTALAHLAEVAPRLYQPLGGLLGTHVPVVPDSEDFVVRPPALDRGGAAFFSTECSSSSRSGRRSSPTRRLSTFSPRPWLSWRSPSRRGRHPTPSGSSLRSTSRWRRWWPGPPPRAARRRWSWVAVLSLAVGHLVGATDASRRLAHAGSRRGPVPAPGPHPGARRPVRARRAPRLRLLRSRVAAHLGERRARRRLPALERALPPLAPSVPRRGAVRPRTWPGC